MRIRLATQDDLEVLARIGVLAHQNDPIYARFYPLRHIYPSEYYRGFLMDLREAFSKPGSIVLVVELEEAEWKDKANPPAGCRGMVGYAVMACHGTQEQKDKWSTDSEDKRLIREALAAEKRDKPNHAMDAAAVSRYMASRLEILGSLENSIVGDSLVILPDCQGTGLGKALFLHTQHMAFEMGMAMVFEATPASLSLYLKHGVQVVGSIQLPTRVMKGEARESTLPETTISVMRARIPGKVHL